MDLRPLNKTVIIECEENLIPVDIDPKVVEAVHRGFIVLPEKNTLMKLSDHANVVRASNDCLYPYKKGQRIRYNQFFDEPMWHFYQGKKYRLIKEWYIDLIYEND
jgi:hypothetical protein